MLLSNLINKERSANIEYILSVDACYDNYEINDYNNIYGMSLNISILLFYFTSFI